jgi:hypothetical protein
MTSARVAKNNFHREEAVGDERIHLKGRARALPVEIAYL